MYSVAMAASAPEPAPRCAAVHVDSEAAGVERALAWRGAPSLAASAGLLALVIAALGGAVEPPRWTYVVLLLAPVGVALGRRLLRGAAARRTPAHLCIDANSVTLERRGAERQFELAGRREGWLTPVGDERAIVGLRLRGGALVCFSAAPADAQRALEAARATPADRPLCFTLERAGPWNLWLRWFGRGPVGARSVTLAVLVVLVALGVRPALWPLAAVLGLALVVAERALLTADPPRIVLGERTCQIAGCGHRSRVPFERIVSVDSTPRGTVLTVPDGREVVLPIASGTPRRRGRTSSWTSEADLRDAQLARQAALVQALNLARARFPPDVVRYWSAKRAKKSLA